MTSSLVNIYNVWFDQHMKLVLPNLQDVKKLIKDDEELFDKLLLNQIRIVPQQVTRNSKLYKTATFNSKITKISA